MNLYHVDIDPVSNFTKKDGNNANQWSKLIRADAQPVHAALGGRELGPGGGGAVGAAGWHDHRHPDRISRSVGGVPLVDPEQAQ